MLTATGSHSCLLSVFSFGLFLEWTRCDRDEPQLSHFGYSLLHYTSVQLAIFSSEMEQIIDTRLLEYFDPKIRPFVENLQIEEEFSILPGSLNIFDAYSGYSTFSL